MKTIGTILTLLAVSISPGLASITVFDAVADFGTASNPTGPWAYGHTDFLAYGVAGSIVLNDTFVTSGALNAWTYPAIDPQFPHVLSSDTDDPVGTVNYQADALALHPALGAGLGPGDTAVVRFVVPVTGLYNISYEFFALDSATNGDGTLVSTGFLAGGMSGPPLVTTLGIVGPGLGASIFGGSTGTLLNAGDVYDFLVFRISDAAQDSTGFRASFILVPEPGTYALVGLGLVGMALWRRRK